MNFKLKSVDKKEIKCLLRNTEMQPIKRKLLTALYCGAVYHAARGDFNLFDCGLNLKSNQLLSRNLL